MDSEDFSMLVYLDSAHFALVERADSQARDHFFRLWVEAKCEAALSVHHLQEIAQVADAASVARRFAAMADFGTLRGGQASSDQALRLELQIEFFRMLGFGVDAQHSGLDSLFAPADLRVLQATTVALQPIFRLMREAHTLGADAENTSKQATLAGPPLNIRRRITPEILEASAAHPALQEAADSNPEVAETMRAMSNLVESKIREHGTVRAALEDLYNLVDVDVRDTLLDSDLASASVFFAAAREEAESVLRAIGRDLEDRDALVRKLNPYQLPGFALQLAVQRGRKRHPKADRAGDQLDVAHLGFAPFVDVLFVDKRTLGFISQEGRRQTASLPADASTNIFRAGTLNQVAGIIAQRAGA
jgi:hypothetical protein